MSAQPVTVHPAPAGTSTRPEVDRLLAEIPLCEDVFQRRALENEVVVRLLELAENTARRYRNRGIPSEDLAQVARLGLVKAVRRYRPGVGQDFAAFAALTMSGEVKRHFRDTGWAVRPPRRLQELRAVIPVESERLAQRLGRHPNANEVAESLGIAAHDVGAARQASAAFAFRPLDGPLEEGAGPRVADPFDAFELVEQRQVLRQALGRLTPRQRRIVRMRFVEERTQREIGLAIGVSQMQVSRLLTSILDTLRAEFADTATAGAWSTPSSELQDVG